MESVIKIILNIIKDIIELFRCIINVKSDCCNTSECDC